MKCNKCGERDPEKFYKSNKTCCKICYKEYYQANRSKMIQQAKVWAQDNFIHFRVISARTRARHKGLEFNIDDRDIENLISQQNNRCFYSGIEFVNDNSRIYSMSIDRIDSSKGYTLDNIRLVSSQVNLMKHERTEEEFLQTIQDIYNHTIRKPT